MTRLLFVFLAIGVVAAPAHADERQPTPGPATEKTSHEAYRAWLRDYYTTLGRSTDPTLQVAAAEYWYVLGKDEARAAELLDSAATHPRRSAGDTWVIANHCASGKSWRVCERNDWYQEAIDFDPDNAAPYLLALKRKDLYDDSSPEADRIRVRLLSSAANANRFDDYWGYSAHRQYRAALEYLNSHPAPEGLIKGMPEKFALGVIMTNMGVNIYPMSGRISLCTGPEMRETCRKLALMAVEHSQTWTTRHMGLYLFQTTDQWNEEERQAVAAEFRDFMNCQGSRLRVDPDQLADDTGSDYESLARELSEYGEVAAYRRANARLYQAHPEAFTLDPSTCNLDGVLGMIDVLAQP